MKALRKRQRSIETLIPNQEEQKKSEIPNFLLKLYQILDTNEFSNIIEWGENGRYFVVKNMNEFTDKVLPRYFKHNNYSSFVRQLNMYDFHKLRNCNNENIFQHKHFIRGQQPLIKTIKRKNNNQRDINEDPNDPEEMGLLDLYEKELNNKKMNKSGLERVINHLTKVLHSTSEKQKDLERKVEFLGKQNEEFLLQNEQLIQELISKGEYTNKLELLILFLIELTVPRTFKGDKNSLTSQQTNNGLIPSSNTSEFKTKSTADSNLGGINRSNLLKTIDGLNSDKLKDMLAKYFDNTNFHKREKIDIPMLTCSNDEYKCKGHDTPFSPINQNSVELSLKNYPSFNNKNFKTDILPKFEIENDKISLFHSPNPFSEDINFPHSNIFNSPRHINDNFIAFRDIHEDNKISDADNNIINMNNFQISRNNSMDLNDFYKTANNMDEEMNKKIDQNFAFDDSYFSVSSDKNKN